MNTDVIILGAGPAGAQAAIYAARKKVDAVVTGKVTGSALHGTHIENYYGVSGVVQGDDLLNNGVTQAKSFGCTVFDQNVVSLSSQSGLFKAVLESGEEIISKALILATGISRKKLGIPGESALFGKGVSYCAVCDCNFYKGAVVMVVGNESEAATSAEVLTKYASKVYWSADSLDVDGSLVDNAKSAGVELLSSRPLVINGTDRVESIGMDDGSTIAVDGIFIELGGRSSADLAMDLGIMPELDDTIKIGADGSTEMEGVFACGDVAGKPWQVAKAVGQGAIAGLSAAEYVRRKQ